MPAPIPPPPPQTTAEETGRAVRLVRLLALGFAAFFGLISLTYDNHSGPVPYGRIGPVNWALWKVESLDLQAARAHPGGRVAWLVGPSTLREAFDEDLVNAALSERASPWRVVKIGVDRGASGLAVALVERLPLQPGDLVVHSLAASHFRPDWLDFAELPHHYLTQLYSPSAWWGIEELSVQERLEGGVAYLPRSFWGLHDDYKQGLYEWAQSPWTGVPKPRKGRRQLHFREVERRAGFREEVGEAAIEERGQGLEDWDASAGQFNMHGLLELEASLPAREVELALIDIEPRRSYLDQMVEPEVLVRWEELRQEHDVEPFPRLPDDHYYDFLHPNARGRELLSAHLVAWLEARP